MPGSSKWSFSLTFPHQNPVYTSAVHHTGYMPCPAHSSMYDHPNNIGEEYRSLSSLLRSFLHSLITMSLLTYLFTPWCRVLLEKLTGLQLVKKFPAFCGTRRFITVLTSVRHLSLSWANPIQSTYPPPGDPS